MPRILRERSRDRTPSIIPFEDLVEEVISREVLNPRSKAFAEQRKTRATLLWKELRKTDALLNARQKRKTAMRIAIEGRVSLSRESILREVEKAEKGVKEKKAKKSKKKVRIVLSPSKEEDEDGEDELA